MKQPAQRKWFPDKYQATLRLRKPDRYSEIYRDIAPYFDTWEEAHAFQIEHAMKRIERAKRDLKSAERYAAKVAALQPNAAVKPRSEAESA